MQGFPEGNDVGGNLSMFQHLSSRPALQHTGHVTYLILYTRSSTDTVLGLLL